MGLGVKIKLVEVDRIVDRSHIVEPQFRSLQRLRHRDQILLSILAKGFFSGGGKRPVQGMHHRGRAAMGIGQRGHIHVGVNDVKLPRSIEDFAQLPLLIDGIFWRQYPQGAQGAIAASVQVG